MLPVIQKDTGMNEIKMGVLVRAPLAILAITLPLSVSAEWTGGVEGGTVLDGENPKTSLELILKNQDRPFSQEINAEWLSDSDGYNTYELSYEPKYWFSDMTYAFGEGAIKTFGAASLDDYQRLLGGGVGIELINTDTQNLFAEVGVFQVTSIVAATELSAEFNESVVSSGFAVGGTQLIADLIKLEIDAEYLTSDNLDVSTAEAGISVKIPNGALKYSFNYISSTIGEAESIENSSSSISVKYNF